MPDSVFNTLSAESRQRGRRERAVLDTLGCQTCIDGCGHVVGRAGGCEHYACFAAGGDIADTCPTAVRAIAAGTPTTGGNGGDCG